MVTTTSRWKSIGLAALIALGAASTSDAQTSIRNETTINDKEITLNRTTTTHNTEDAGSTLIYSHTPEGVDIGSLQIQKNNFSTSIHSSHEKGAQDLYLQATSSFGLSEKILGYAGAGKHLNNTESHYLYAGADLEVANALVHTGFTHFNAPGNTAMNFQHIGVDRENTYHALANNNGELVAINSFATKNNQHGLVNLSIYDPQDGTFFSKTQTGHGDISLRFTGEVGRLITNQFQGPFHPSYISEIGNNGNVSSSLTLTNARESLDATAKIGARNILGPISAVAGMRYNQNHGIDAIPLTLQATHKGEHLGAYFEITHNVLTKNTGAYLSVQYQL